MRPRNKKTKVLPRPAPPTSPPRHRILHNHLLFFSFLSTFTSSPNHLKDVSTNARLQTNARPSNDCPAGRQHCPCPRRRRWGTALHDPHVSPFLRSPVISSCRNTFTHTDSVIHSSSYPLITLSTRAQVESKRAQSSTYDAVRRIVQREGVTGLYSGLDSALFGISVTNFVYYYCACSEINLSIPLLNSLHSPPQFNPTPPHQQNPLPLLPFD